MGVYLINWMISLEFHIWQREKKHTDIVMAFDQQYKTVPNPGKQGP